MVATGRDQGDCLSCAHQIHGHGNSEKGSKVNEILWTLHVVSREHLQCNQVPGARDMYLQVRQKVDWLGICDDFSLDPRGRKQGVDDWCVGFLSVSLTVASRPTASCSTTASIS